MLTAKSVQNSGCGTQININIFVYSYVHIKFELVFIMKLDFINNFLKHNNLVVLSKAKKSTIFNSKAFIVSDDTK